MQCKEKNILSRREHKKANTRRRLLDAAIQLFRDQGYHQTSVEEITAAAEIAKGTFFNYFSTKEDILRALLERRTKALEDTLVSAQGVATGPIARIKLILKLVAEDPVTEQLLKYIAAHGKMPFWKDHPNRPLVGSISDQVEQAQSLGQIRPDLDAVYVSGMIIALFVHQIACWHHGYRPFPLPNMIETAVDSLVDGIADPERRSS